jgi:hypothetical protein
MKGDTIKNLESRGDRSKFERRMEIGKKEKNLDDETSRSFMADADGCILHFRTRT